MSSNLISRSTVNAFTKSFLLQLILDTRIEYLGSFFVIFRNFRRTRILNTMRVVSTHLATSTATTTISVIPTDTPITNKTYYSWRVYFAGYFDDGSYIVGDSYGKSPTMGSTHGACYVRPSGDASSIGVSYSYGRLSPSTKDANYVCHVFSSGSIEYRYNFYVDYSCGRTSSRRT